MTVTLSPVNLTRRYCYVGPADLRSLPQPVDLVDVESPTVLDRWLEDRKPRDRVEPFTYMVTVDGALRIAPRQCEHVACTGGTDVLAAGEMRFEYDETTWAVTQVSNQSTGYCPDLDSWHAIAAALDRLDVRHPDGFTHPIVFRVCPACCAINIVHDDIFECIMCPEELPREWNLDQF